MKIQTPTLLINKEKCRANISQMAEKAKKHQLHFRPHFKTHQNAAIGELFREQNIESITVSSVDMAVYFKDHGWKDITIAFSCNILEIDKINKLGKGIKLNLVIESKEVVQFLSDKLRIETGIYIKLDSGYHRTGIDYSNFNRVDGLIEMITGSDKMNLEGFLMHAGHSYKAGSKSEILDIHKETLIISKKLKEKYPDIKISIGDTPGCSLADEFTNIDEIRPGNFVYYDHMQLELGSCDFANIAVSLACPVVAIHERRNEAVIYGGGVHLSKEFIQINGQSYFGLVVKINDDGKWEYPEKAYLKGISQEHGVIKGEADFISELKPGDVLGIIPVHSCMTADLMKLNSKIL